MADRSAPGTSTGNTRALLRVVLDEAGSYGVDQVLRQAGLSSQRELLLSVDGRVPYPDKLRLFDAAAHVLADPRIGLRLGAASMQDESMEPWRQLAREQGSPEAAYRRVSPFSTRFDSATLLTCHRADRESASLSWKVIPPFRPNRVDCDAQMSFLAQIPAVFGLPPANVIHGYACQVSGAAECRYEVTWTSQPLKRLTALLRKPATTDAHNRSTKAEHRLRTLESATADLASMDSWEQVLDRILDRADSAVHAPGHLLAVQTSANERHVRTRGLGEVLARDLDETGTALSELSPLLEGLTVLSVPVQSSKRFYGFLAAVAHPGQEFYPDDTDALASYAQHAAVSLDIAGTVTEAREYAETAHLLLNVSRSLDQHTTVASLAGSLADAVTALTDADRSAIALWDPGTGRLRIAGISGWHGEQARKLACYVVDSKDSPELADMVATRSPMLVDSDSSDWARAMLAEFGIAALVGVPITTRDRFAGVVLAHWVAPGPAALDGTLTERLGGLASLASVGMDRIGLLDHTRRQALHDTLTGLPNRALFEDRLDTALARTSGTGSQVGILFCDICRFKRINESLGHAAGDTALRHVASRLQSSAPDPNTVARYSGDQFVILLPEVDDIAQVNDVAEKIRASLSEPVDIDGDPVVLEVAIGTTTGRARPGNTAGPHTESGRILVAEADLEMSRAKARARGHSAPRGLQKSDLKLEADMRGAAARGELRVQFQPQIDVKSGSVVAAEALVRWDHPELGLLPPGRFIPLAEDSDLIAEIGSYVLSTACSVGARWLAAGHLLELAVNVSSVQLSDPYFPSLVQDTLIRTGFPAASLTLEVTESQAMSDSSVNDGNLRALRNLGVGISIDDFGTGYSSLSQLHRMPVTEVKIDQSFTARVGDDRSNTFIAGIVGLAHGLGLTAIAEGVETPDQLAVLAKIGCDRAQGFLFGKPMDAAKLEEILTAPHTAAGVTQEETTQRAPSARWTLVEEAAEDARATLYQAVEKAGYHVERSEGTTFRVHVPRSIRQLRRPSWITGTAKTTGARTEITWSSDDNQNTLDAFLLEIEKKLPAGVLDDYGLAEAARNAGLTPLDQDAARRIAKLLDPSDTVRAIGQGQLASETGFVVLTEEKLIFACERVEASGITDLPLSSVDAIHLGKRSSGEILTVTAGEKPLEISRMGHGEGHGISTAFREIKAANNRNPTTAHEEQSLTLV